MIKYLSKVWKLQTQLSNYSIYQILKSANVQADRLAKLTTSQTVDLDNTVYIEILEAPSTEEATLILCTTSEPSWMDPIIIYLKSETLPTDSSAARKIKCLTLHYTLMNRQIHKRSFSSPLLKCLLPSEADYALREVHEGICGNHLEGQAFAYKIL